MLAIIARIVAAQTPIERTGMTVAAPVLSTISASPVGVCIQKQWRLFMTPEALAYRAIAAWFITYLLVKTDAPFGLFKRLRAGAWHGGMLDCVFCTGFWVGLICALVPDGWLLHGFTVGGLALLLHGFSQWRHS